MVLGRSFRIQIGQYMVGDVGVLCKSDGSAMMNMNIAHDQKRKTTQSQSVGHRFILSSISERVCVCDFNERQPLHLFSLTLSI